MNKMFSWIKSEHFHHHIYPEIERLVAVVVFTIIYGIGVSWFLEASVVPLYTGGIPGVAQLVRDAMFVWFNIDVGDGFLGIFVIVMNIPILLIGWFGISRKFTIHSLISVLLQALIIGWLPRVNFGLNSVEHVLAASVLGGLLIGIGAGGALKYGTSTGGLDIIAQYYSLKKGKTVGFISMAMNVTIAILGGFIVGGKETTTGVVITGGVIASYTVIRIIISTIITDKVHTSYQFLSVDIITVVPQSLVDEILVKVYRGVTLMRVEGAYSRHEKTQIFVVISADELHTRLRLVKEVDPHAFIVTRPVRNVFGNFQRKTIA